MPGQNPGVYHPLSTGKILFSFRLYRFGVFRVFTHGSAKFGNSHLDSAGKQQDYARKHPKENCQDLKQHTTGIWVNIHNYYLHASKLNTSFIPQ